MLCTDTINLQYGSYFSLGYIASYLNTQKILNQPSNAENAVNTF